MDFRESGRRELGVAAMNTRFSFEKMKMFWNWTVVMVM